MFEGCGRGVLHGEVFKRVRLDSHEHGVAHDGENRSTNDEYASSFIHIAHPCDEDGVQTSDAIWWYTVELSLESSPAEVDEDGRQKERERLHRDVDAEESQCTDEIVNVEDSSLDVVFCCRLVCRLLVLSVDALECDVAIPRCEELALVGCRGEDEHADAREYKGKQAFEEEDVAPVVNLAALDSPGGNWGQSSC